MCLRFRVSFVSSDFQKYHGKPKRKTENYHNKTKHIKTEPRKQMDTRKVNLNFFQFHIKTLASFN